MQHLIIVGGSKGIGRAFCLLAASAYEVVTVISRNKPSGSEDLPKNVLWQAMDVADEKSVTEVLPEVVERNGRVNGLAFFQRHRGDNSWEGNLKVCLSATRNVILTLKNHFALEGERSIAIISSIASRFVANEQDEGYHVAKAGLIGMTRYFAYELGALGIRVNAISPGTVLKSESAHFFLENEPLHQLYKEVTPLGRMGTANEVAEAVKFILSPQASFITGQEIVVDGGAGLNWQESLSRRLKSL